MDTRNYTYEQDAGGRYCLNVPGGEVVCVGTSIAIGYIYDQDLPDREKIVMIKHGSPETIGSWKDSWERKPEDIKKLMGSIHMIQSSEWDLEILNAILAGCYWKLEKLHNALGGAEDDTTRLTARSSIEDYQSKI